MAGPTRKVSLASPRASTRRSDAESAKETILGHRRLTKDFRQAAVSDATLKLHLPESILRGHESLSKEGVMFVISPDVGNTPMFAADVNGLLQSGHVQSRSDISKGCLQIGVGDATGHSPSRANGY